MRDVAQRADVSIKTVSRVVNDEPGVHPDTASRVRAAIEQLGFRRYLSAWNLQRGVCPRIVGLVLGDVRNPFHTLLARAVEEVARRYDCQVLIGSSAEDPTQERELLSKLCSRPVDGLIVVPAAACHGSAAQVRGGTPLVFVDRPGGDPTVDAVIIDNLAGSAMIVRHLVEQGHSRIAFVGESVTSLAASERLRGFREAGRRLGIAHDERLVLLGPHTPQSVAASVSRLLSRADPATAVITGSSRITIMLLRALTQVPSRPAIAGFDDFELANLLDPPVTVLAHDAEAMGRTAAELLFRRMGGDRSPPRRIVLPAYIVPRGSGETVLKLA